MPFAHAHPFDIGMPAQAFFDAFQVLVRLRATFLVGDIPVFVRLLQRKVQFIGILDIEACRGTGGDGQDAQVIDNVPHQCGYDKQLQHDPDVETALCPY